MVLFGIQWNFHGKKKHLKSIFFVGKRTCSGSVFFVSFLGLMIFEKKTIYSLRKLDGIICFIPLYHRTY